MSMLWHPNALPLACLAFSWLVSIPRTQAIENMPDPVAILDLYDRVIDINRSALNFLGIHRNQALGYILQQLIPGEVEKLRGYQDSWNLQEELQLGSPDAPLYFSMSITPLYDRRTQSPARQNDHYPRHQ